MNIVYHSPPYISRIVLCIYTALPCVDSSLSFIFFNFFFWKINNVLDTVLQLEFSVLCGIRLFKLCLLLSLRTCMTCSCISFHVVYLLYLPFRSLFIPTSPRERQSSFNNIYNKLPSSFCRFLFFSIFSDLVSGVDILSNS